MLIVLLSLEIISLSRVCLIVHLLICFPNYWFAVSFNKLYSYNWSVRSMGRMANILENTLEYILSYDNIFPDEDFTTCSRRFGFG